LSVLAQVGWLNCLLQRQDRSSTLLARWPWPAVIAPGPVRVLLARDVVLAGRTSEIFGGSIGLGRAADQAVKQPGSQENWGILSGGAMHGVIAVVLDPLTRFSWGCLLA
jgi:hypothetical protein